MAIAIGGVKVDVSRISDYVLAGGDTNTLIIPGTEEYPSSRGLHTLMAYLAPMDKWYDDWAGRLHSAAGHTIDDWRANDVTLTQAGTVATAIQSTQDDLVKAKAGATAGIEMWKFSIYANPLYNQDLRMALDMALATVDTAAVAIKRGEDLYKVKATDLHIAHDSYFKVLADQGTASARTMGEAAQYTGQALSLNNRGRMLAVDQARFENQKSFTQQQQSQESSASLFNTIGKVAGFLAL